MRERVAALESDLDATVGGLNDAIAQLNVLLAEKRKATQRSWGPEQVTGPPDTHSAGDHHTAWAPRQQDGGEEWLQTAFARRVEIAAVRVRETFNPGAISKVAAVLEGGREIVLWQGTMAAAGDLAEPAFSAPAGIVARNVKVYLDTKRVPGWNEIDAVELVARDGSRQWAQSATASSTYAEGSSRALTHHDSLNLR